MRYLRTMAAAGVLSFGLVWIWVVTMPMAFMDAEYPSWQAKQIMLARCDLGETIILGDSRAAADILAARLPVVATNLAVGGGEPMEALAALNRALECHTLPRMVIVSFNSGHFTKPDQFWERSVRFGLLSGADIAMFRAASHQTGDTAIYRGRYADGLPALARDGLYELHFPSLYFSNLMHGGLMLRWMRNQAGLEATLAARGHYYFGTERGSDTVAVDGHMDNFTPMPILDFYFDRLLATLDAHGIETRFVAMPVNDATWNSVRPGVREAFAAYLAGYERRYPHFRVASDIMPHWPDRFFGDQFCHLNPEGAERFTAQLAQRLQEAPPRTQNDAQKGWLSETGAAASPKVVPISKRGS